MRAISYASGLNITYDWEPLLFGCSTMALETHTKMRLQNVNGAGWSSIFLTHLISSKSGRRVWVSTGLDASVIGSSFAILTSSFIVQMVEICIHGLGVYPSLITRYTANGKTTPPCRSGSLGRASSPVACGARCGSTILTCAGKVLYAVPCQTRLGPRLTAFTGLMVNPSLSLIRGY